ncbi:hypothetical protein YC2023_088160 [Brassica napus]
MGQSQDFYKFRSLRSHTPTCHLTTRSRKWSVSAVHVPRALKDRVLIEKASVISHRPQDRTSLVISRNRVRSLTSAGPISPSLKGSTWGVCSSLIYLDLIQKWVKSSLERLVEELCLREVLVDVARSIYKDVREEAGRESREEGTHKLLFFLSNCSSSSAIRLSQIQCEKKKKNKYRN